MLDCCTSSQEMSSVLELLEDHGIIFWFIVECWTDRGIKILVRSIDNSQGNILLCESVLAKDKLFAKF
jgi:hypothetical protein